MTNALDITVVFEDSLGLMEALANNERYCVSYSDEGLEKFEATQGFWIGVQVPFEDTKAIILETLKRYPHIRYYTLSNDFYKRPAFFHSCTVIGGLTETAETLAVRPIDAETMRTRLQSMDTGEQFFEFVRSFYPEGYKTWPIEEAEAEVAAPAGPPPIHVLEFLDDSKETERRALGIVMSVDTVREFLDKMRHVKEAFTEWLLREQDNAALFSLRVTADNSQHEEIDDWIKRIYHEEQEFGPLLHAVDFEVAIESFSGNVKIDYVLEGIPPDSGDDVKKQTSLWNRIKGLFG